MGERVNTTGRVVSNKKIGDLLYRVNIYEGCGVFEIITTGSDQKKDRVFKNSVTNRTIVSDKMYPEGLEALVAGNKIVFECKERAKNGCVLTKVIDCDGKVVVGEAEQTIKVVDNFLVVKNNSKVESDSIRNFEGGVIYASQAFPEKISIDFRFDEAKQRYVVFDANSGADIIYLNTTKDKKVVDVAYPEQEENCD